MFANINRAGVVTAGEEPIRSTVSLTLETFETSGTTEAAGTHTVSFNDLNGAQRLNGWNDWNKWFTVSLPPGSVGNPE